MLSAEFLRQILNALDANVFVKTRDGRYVFINDRCTKTAMLPRDKFLGRTDFEVFPPAIAMRNVNDDQLAMDSTNGIVRIVDYRIDEEIRKFYTLKKPFPGHLDLLLGISFDVTDYESDRAKLKQNEFFLRLIIDNDPSAIYVKSTNGKYKLANQSLAAFYQRPVAEVVGKLDGELSVRSDEVEVFAGEDHRVRTTRQSIRARNKFTDPSGVVHWLDTIKLPLVHPDGEVDVLGISRDVTEQVKVESEKLKTQARLLQASRLSSIEHLASGIAHEINNPLAVISGLTSQLQRLLESPIENIEKIKEKIGKISTSAQRIGRIVVGMRTFSGDMENEIPVETSVKELVSSNVALVQSRLRNHGIVLDIQVGEDPLRVRCRPNTISYVLMQLLSNAHDAVLESHPNGVKRIAVKIESVESKVQISIADNGSGLSDQVKKNLFMPFVTTKESNKGAGLGLSTSYGLLRQHGGNLRLEENQTETTFVVEIPKIAA